MPPERHTEPAPLWQHRCDGAAEPANPQIPEKLTGRWSVQQPASKEIIENARSISDVSGYAVRLALHGPAESPGNTESIRRLCTARRHSGLRRHSSATPIATRGAGIAGRRTTGRTAVVAVRGLAESVSESV